MKQFIVNADDFGLCRGVNLGILHAHREGIVTSATLMVNMPAADDAFTRARLTPSLGVGLHIALTAGRPLAAGVESLTGPDGRFLKLPALAASARPDHLEKEIRTQVQAFLSQGLKPDHLDSHHHVHVQIPAAASIVEAVGRELGVPVRASGMHFTERFYGAANVTVERLLDLLAHLEDGLTEMMCHPAYLDPYLLENSSYNGERVRELATLCDPRVKAALADHGIQLINFREAAAASPGRRSEQNG